MLGARCCTKIEFGSESPGGPVYSLAKSSRHRILRLFAPLAARVYDPSKSSLYLIRARVFGIVFYPSENSHGRLGSHRILVPVGGSILHPNPVAVVIEHIVSINRNSDVMHFGSPSGLGRVYHPPNQSWTSVIHLNPVMVVIEFRLSIMHRPGPRFAHRRRFVA